MRPGQQIGQLHVAQQRPFARPGLQPRRLLDLDRHHRQARQEDQRAERRPLPDVHRRDGDERAGRDAQPVEAARSRTQPTDCVGDAEIAVEDQPADQADDGVGGRQRHRPAKRGRARAGSRARSMQHQRGRQPERDLDRHHAEKEAAPVRPSVLPEGGVGQDVDVIGEADERKAVAHAGDIVLAERGDEREQRRIEADQRQREARPAPGTRTASSARERGRRVRCRLISAFSRVRRPALDARAA